MHSAAAAHRSHQGFAALQLRFVSRGLGLGLLERRSARPARRLAHLPCTGALGNSCTAEEWSRDGGPGPAVRLRSGAPSG